VLRRLLLALAILVVAWVALCLVLFTWPPAADDPPEHADAVVVLSGGLNARLDPALALMRRRVAPVLAISGARHDPKWKKARRLCSGLEGPTRYRVICFEPTPYSTRGESRAIAQLAARHGWTRVVVVTSTFHVTRAKLLIGRCYHGRLWLVGTSSPLLRQPQEWATETGKLLVQLIAQRGC
jgi:uncharacterized SAM-binding protein YcdF (DUF218 family)